MRNGWFVLSLQLLSQSCMRFLPLLLLSLLLLAVAAGGESVLASSLSASDVENAYEQLAARFIRAYTIRVSVECLSGPCVQTATSYFPSLTKLELRVDNFGRSVSGYPVVKEGLASLVHASDVELVSGQASYWVANQLRLNYTAFATANATQATLSGVSPRFATNAGRVSMEGLLYTLASFMRSQGLPATTAFNPATLLTSAGPTSTLAKPPDSSVAAFLASPGFLNETAYGNFTNVSSMVEFVRFERTPVTTPTRTSELLMPSELLVTEAFHTFFFNESARRYQEVVGGMYTRGNTTNVWNVTLSDYTYKAVDNTRLQNRDALLRALAVKGERAVTTANYSAEMLASCSGACPVGSDAPFPYGTLGMEVNRTANGTAVSETFLRLVDASTRLDVSYHPAAIKQAKTTDQLFALASYALLLPPTADLVPVVYRPAAAGDQLLNVPFPTSCAAGVDEVVGRVTYVVFSYSLKVETTFPSNTTSPLFFGDLADRAWVFTGGSAPAVASFSWYPTLFSYDRLPMGAAPFGGSSLASVRVASSSSDVLTAVKSIAIGKYQENTTGYVPTPIDFNSGSGGATTTTLLIIVVVVVGGVILLGVLILGCCLYRGGCCALEEDGDCSSDDEVAEPAQTRNIPTRSYIPVLPKGPSNPPPSHRAAPTFPFGLEPPQGRPLSLAEELPRSLADGVDSRVEIAHDPEGRGSPRAGVVTPPTPPPTPPPSRSASRGATNAPNSQGEPFSDSQPKYVSSRYGLPERDLSPQRGLLVSPIPHRAVHNDRAWSRAGRGDTPERTYVSPPASRSVSPARSVHFQP